MHLRVTWAEHDSDAGCCCTTIVQMDIQSGVRIPLPKFIKIMTENGVPVSRAMAVAGKMHVFLCTACSKPVTLQQLQGV